MAAVAAVCGVVLGLGALGARLFLKPENGVFVVTGEDSKGRFVLPDGTQVWLNYDSRLYYPESFDGNLRSVRLEGEALFNVVRDASKPFRVRTSLMEVEVLGTVFDLKCYEHLDYAELVLVSGSVKATWMPAVARHALPRRAAGRLSQFEKDRLPGCRCQ